MDFMPPPRRKRGSADRTIPRVPGLSPEAMTGLTPEQISERATAAREREAVTRRRAAADALAERVTPLLSRRQAPKAAPAPAPAPAPSSPSAPKRSSSAPAPGPARPTDPLDTLTDSELAYVGQLVVADRMRRRGVTVPTPGSKEADILKRANALIAKDA